MLLAYLVVLVVATCGSPSATQPPSPPPSTQAAIVSPAPTPAPIASTAPPTPSPMPSPSDLGGARAHTEALSAISSRVAGTAAEQQAAVYVALALAAAGYEPQSRPFTATSWSGKRVNSANVVAVKEGASAREIVVGAHYDSTPGSYGADDNASGVAVMLELAELLADEPTPYTIVFVAFGAEEVGFLGSNAFVAQMTESARANVVAMVNLDSVAAGDFQYVYSDEGPRAAPRDWVLAWAAAHGLDLKTIRDVDLNDSDGDPCSDYGAFQAAGIPFVYLEATNWKVGAQDGYTQVATRYANRGVIRHTRFDTLSYLDSTFPGRVDAHLDLAVTVVRALLTEYTE